MRTKKITQLRNVISKKDLIKIKGFIPNHENFVFLYYKHYANLNHKDIPDNKQFWRTVKPLLSDKAKLNEKITLVEDNKTMSKDKDNAELLNSFFPML